MGRGAEIRNKINHNFYLNINSFFVLFTAEAFYKDNIVGMFGFYDNGYLWGTWSSDSNSGVLSPYIFTLN